jgi:hypothetical protein
MPVPAAVDRDAGEPGAPVRRRASELLGFVGLQEDCLHHVIGLLWVAQEQATQPWQPPVVGGDQQILPGGGFHL